MSARVVLFLECSMFRIDKQKKISFFLTQGNGQFSCVYNLIDLAVCPP